MPNPNKSFQSIQDDYDFFEACVNEISRTISLWKPTLWELGRQHSSLRVLDFGCGSGSFTALALACLDREPEEIELTLLEPAGAALERALIRFQERPLGALKSCSDIEALPRQTFELILSHHVFYYVPELDQVLRRLKERLAPGGLFLTAIAGDRSGPGLLQDEALKLAGLSSPYRSGLEVREIFLKHFPNMKLVPYATELLMPDSRDNREAILRFLVGEFREKIPWSRALSIFDPDSDGKQVRVPSEEWSLLVNG